MANRKKWTDTDKAVALGLKDEGKSYTDIERLTGVPRSTVSMWVIERRDAQDAEQREQAATVTPPPSADDAPPDFEYRAADRRPSPTADAKQAPPPDLDYRELQDYISGFYKLAANITMQSDAALGEAIVTHADAAGEAWAEWVKSEPKVAAMLQRLMIGTPLGKVIGVHVSIVIGYVFARQAQANIAAEAAAAAAAADGYGQSAAA